MDLIVVVVVISSSSKNFTWYYKPLQISETTPSELQKAAILGTAYILH